MRGLVLTLAAAVLTLTFGCRNQDGEVYPQEQARAGAPRTSLYPLTSPPPGSVQPIQGYAPTRITASYDEAYASAAPGGYGAGPAPAAQNSGYQSSGYQSSGYQSSGYYAAPRQGGYVASPASYNPGPAGSPGDPFAETVPNPFTPNGGVCYVEEITAFSNPNVPIKDPPVLVNQVNVNTPYPGFGTTTAAYTPPASPYAAGVTTAAYAPQQPVPAAAPGGYAGGTPGYAPPRLSAVGSYGAPAAYAGAPSYRSALSSYGSSGVVGEARTGLSYGPVEGTADIVMSPALNGYVTPASSLPGYGMGPAGPGTTQSYSGGAFPAVTATIPATYSEPAPAAYAPIRPGVPAAPAASFGAGEIRLVPAPDIPPGFHPNDAGPSQWFEIIRSNNAAIRIGRVSATCVCVGVRVPKRQVAAGERALVEARIVTRPQVREVTYGMYVNIVEPVQTVVDADVTISL